MATTDVMMKCISGNDIQNGSIITGVDKTGHIQVLHPPSGFNKAPVPESVETLLTNRFDDNNYYSN